jgi:LmbE family N-acetylglucosaminyl deacetylase
VRILILAPHADDEVLGCGGMLARRAAEGHEVQVVVASIGTVHAPDGRLKVTGEARRAELLEAARRLSIPPPRVLYEELENRLDTLPRTELLGRLDALLLAEPWDQVFFPFASHHQDHRVLHEATWSALRQRPQRRTERLAALYEYPYVGWAPAPVPGGRWYVDIGAQLERKLHALAAYVSQAAPAEHPLSARGVEALAALRGAECGVRHAELFYVVRMLD